MKKRIVLLGIIMVLFMQTMASYAASRVENTDRGTVYITDETKVVPSLTKSTKNANGTWHEDANGWWFEYSGGGYPQNTWEEINSYWYYFNESGYMVTGWVLVNGIWYFCETSDQAAAPHGSMITGWKQVNNEWYFFETEGTSSRPLGSMIKGWWTYNGNHYFFRKIQEGTHPAGSMVIGTYHTTVEGSDLVHEFKTSGELQYIYANVVRRKQDKSNWCWVASAEMVGKYANPSSTLTQSSVVSSMVLDDFNIPGFISMSNIALRKFGGSAIRTSEPYGKPMDFLQTAENIISARPLVAVLKWDLLSGHMVVISGFSIDENIRIIDPWDNSKTIYAPYAQALNGYQFETGFGTYTDCIYFGR